MSSGFSHRAYVACGSVSYMGLMASCPRIFCLLPISAIIFFYYFLLCTIIWNIQIKSRFEILMYFSFAVLDNDFRLLPSCLRCLWVCCLDGSHAWGSIACLGCQKIFTCETRVLHSTPQSLTYWFDWMSQRNHASFLVKVPQNGWKSESKNGQYIA